MEATSISSLSEMRSRLEIVEVRNRLLVFLCCLALIGSISFQVVWAQNAPKEEQIEARRFILKDDAGKVRAVLATTENGAAALVFFDSAGKQHSRLMVGINGDGQPSLQLNDARDTQRAVFGLDEADAPGIDFADRAGRRRVRLNVADRAGEQPAALTFTDGKGKARVTVISSQTMHGFSLLGPDESVRSSVVTLDDGTPLSSITGRDGKIIWSAP